MDYLLYAIFVIVDYAFSFTIAFVIIVGSLICSAIKKIFTKARENSTNTLQVPSTQVTTVKDTSRTPAARVIRPCPQSFDEFEDEDDEFDYVQSHKDNDETDDDYYEDDFIYYGSATVFPETGERYLDMDEGFLPDGYVDINDFLEP